MRHSRALQSTFRSIVCATRFKYFEKGGLLPAQCQYCGCKDRYKHLVECVNIGKHPGEPEELVEYLVELTSRAYNVNPNLPAPQRRGEGEEEELMLLEEDADAEDEILGFEDDVMAPFNERLLLLDG